MNKTNPILVALVTFGAALGFQNCSGVKSENDISPASLGPSCSVSHKDGTGNTNPSFTVTQATSVQIENTVTSSEPSLEVWAKGSNNGTAIAPVSVGTLDGAGKLIWNPCSMGAAVGCPVGTYVRSYDLKDGSGNTICSTNAISVTVQ